MSPYRAPAWLPGGHLQTLYAALLAPRAHVAFVRTRWDTPDGDFIELDCDQGRLHLDISDEELAARLAALANTDMGGRGGYQRLYVDHVLQADDGCDFDFLVGCRGSAVPRHSH